MFVVSWALEWGRLAKQRTLETVIYDEQRAMLVDTLTDSCKLACLHYNKRAEFVENFISSAALRKTSGTALKDILVELVQNAVAHGIEAPDLRLRAGKNETGRITLSIYEKNNMIRAELNDDGAGFDFGEASRGAANYVKSLFGSSSRRNEARAPRTGLNIVCSRLIALRGKLNIKTKMGRGSSFIIDVAVLSHNAGPKLADSV
jgi:two-component system chemotaxis sensor kinase CheA